MTATTEPRFWILRPPDGRTFGTKFAFAEVLDPAYYGEAGDMGHCPKCGDPLGDRPWLPPHRIALSSRRYPDFLWGAGVDLLVSERFRQAYEEAGLTGILRFDPPAEIVRVGRKRADAVQPPPPEYRNVRYVAGGASLDDVRSEAWRRYPTQCSYCRESISGVRRVVFEPGSWTGADIFEAYGLPGNIVVSERFKDLVDRHGFTGADLIPAEEYSFCVDRYVPWGTIGRGY